MKAWAQLGSLNFNQGLVGLASIFFFFNSVRLRRALLPVLVILVKPHSGLIFAQVMFSDWWQQGKKKKHQLPKVCFSAAL